MNWTKPEFEEVALGMEVTGYVNTDEPAPVNQPDLKRSQHEGTEHLPIEHSKKA
jgi:coenzyme PQQ precursor peptide PqqA